MPRRRNLNTFGIQSNHSPAEKKRARQDFIMIQASADRSSRSKDTTTNKPKVWPKPKPPTNRPKRKPK